MKLAEALMLRADYQRRLEQLKQRLIRNAKAQEGIDPAEHPPLLVDEIERTSRELTRLIQNINRTNASTALNDRMSIADALAVRDALAWRQAAYRDLAQAASVVQDRFSRSEVRWRSTVDVTDIQRRADTLAIEYRELDTRIQEKNWLTELQELE